MDPAIVSRILQAIEINKTWECKLFFPDLRDTGGFVDLYLCKFMEFTLDSEENQRKQSTYTDTTGYFFDTSKYIGTSTKNAS
jgi:hypothetical protein